MMNADQKSQLLSALPVQGTLRRALHALRLTRSQVARACQADTEFAASLRQALTDGALELLESVVDIADEIPVAINRNSDGERDLLRTDPVKRADARIKARAMVAKAVLDEARGVTDGAVRVIVSGGLSDKG